MAGKFTFYPLCLLILILGLFGHFWAESANLEATDEEEVQEIEEEKPNFANQLTFRMFT